MSEVDTGLAIAFFLVAGYAIAISIVEIRLHRRLTTIARLAAKNRCADCLASAIENPADSDSPEASAKE